jgi:1-aminocyclopropane-1-carboxylate deaminase
LSQPKLTLSASRVEEIVFAGRHLYLKRDDLLHPDFSGNKARKFYGFLTSDFSEIRRLVSYGSAQSNAMFSLSVLARMRGWRFDYFVDHLSGYLREFPHGNYQAALKNGMQLHIGPVDASLRKGPSVLFVEEGGRQQEAAHGLEMLAEEIEAWRREKRIERLHLFLPSGTGTTAYYLQAFLRHVKVYTTPCVADATYLLGQFKELGLDSGLYPEILLSARRYHFGKLYRAHYEIWLKLLQETGIEFDLLYDPIGWRAMLEHPGLFEVPVMYLHQGGILGNESMLRRYRRKYPGLET